MSIAVENITTEDLGWEEYSAIKDMEFYTVLFRDNGDIDIYDGEDKAVRDNSLFDEIAHEVIEFRKGEK